MKFDQDLFISYAHLDNKPLPPSEAGWISRFHEALQTFVNMRMGEEVRVWRDDKLSGTDVFSDEIVDQFKKTALLISILTPRYVQSDWCSKEVKEFCEAAEETGGVAIDNKSRLIKIIKTPIESEGELPAIASKVLGYEFFTRGIGGAPLELDTVFGAEQTQAYYEKIAQLAWDIKQLLDTIREEDGAAETLQDDTDEKKPTVFVAECCYDQTQQRERLVIELKTHGYHVLPTTMLPKVENEQINEVGKQLEQCQLAVHVIGNSYGSIPDGTSQKSNVEIQNELAARRSKTTGMKRIIWVPEDITTTSDLQKQFVAALHTDAGVQCGADLITGDFEEFKAAVHAALKRLQETETSQVEVKDVGNGDDRMVYLICNREDRKATVPLRKILRSAGIEAKTPAFEGDAASVREANNNLLRNCDALLLFYGTGDEAWKRSVDNDVKKIFGYGRDKPLRAKFTYLAAPATADKQDLVDLEEPDLIDGLDGFSPEDLKLVISALAEEHGAE